LLALADAYLETPLTGKVCADTVGFSGRGELPVVPVIARQIAALRPALLVFGT